MKVSSLRNWVSVGVSKMRGRVEGGPIAGVLVRGEEDTQRGRGGEEGVSCADGRRDQHGSVS